MPNENAKRKTLRWSRLDNAAKIFPPTSHGSDTGVFRLSCELAEPVEPDVLQEALDRTIKRYPHLMMVMRRGVFWYYLEQTGRRASVEPEHTPPCAPLYFGSQSLLFRVSYWHHKINLEVYHVLADGSGAIEFFQALLTDYLSLRHPEAGADIRPQASVSQRGSDSFQKYYRPNAGGSNSTEKSRAKVYHLRGVKRQDGGLTVIEGVADVRQLLEAAHRCGATLTAYMAALLILAIHGEIYVREQKKDIVLTVPVDLRSFFPSRTTRNFFGTIRVGYNFGARSGELTDIVQCVAQAFKTELTPERVGARMNKMAALEHNPLLRPIPLVLKNPVLRLSGDISERGETAVISNVGRFQLPEPLCPFVRGFGAFMTTHATQLCTCTFGNSLHFGFTSAFENTEVQRRFFELLTGEGIDVEIRSSEYHEEEDAPCSDAQAVE
ncbi:hypothetical protein [Agathobaculum desmolans]|uniref:hypothetical protein n=1 Tax=Agathobaculum desmolans TaxID=39484 RepID=UPI0004E23DE6|nr:hypothetical protein [Agathobaculum desmolans]